MSCTSRDKAPPPPPRSSNPLPTLSRTCIRTGLSISTLLSFSVYVLSSHWQWRILTGDPLSNYKRSVSSEIDESAKLGPFSGSRAHIFEFSSLRCHPYYLRAWKRLHKLTSFRMVSPTRYPKKSVKLTGWPFDFFCKIMLTCLYIQDGVNSSHIQLSFTFSRSSSLTFRGWIFGHSGCE